MTPPSLSIGLCLCLKENIYYVQGELSVSPTQSSSLFIKLSEVLPTENQNEQKHQYNFFKSNPIKKKKKNTEVKPRRRETETRQMEKRKEE
mmetsp:Transcript_26033/g.29800  ORF Transcript_26033/g.29800 Transcript_26033/m.29800 type:complete len:91 (-) Transcript_26033:538-810(-)